MQAVDTNELPERSRYYLGCCDVDSLQAGGKYKDLKDTYIIFICIPDLFEKGMCIYRPAISGVMLSVSCFASQEWQ